MGFLDTVAAADANTGGFLSGIVNRQVARILPAGTLSPNAAASVARPSVQGSPSLAPEATYVVGGWRALAQKPVVWAAGGLLAVVLIWKLFAKRGK